MVRMIMLLVLCAAGAFAGSACPLRRNIYPCTCANVHLSRRKAHTVVTCRSLPNSDSLNEIIPTLKTMEIDQFHMYDSFWVADELGAGGESQKVLPTDWITLMKAKEVEIIDSTLTSCFACQWSLACSNSITTTFKVINSTSTEKICSLCDTGRGTRLSWIGCMSKLQHFQLSYGNIKSLTTDFFPVAMRELKILNLSNNQIVKIDPNTFKNIPNLKTLDLSHNAIEHIDHIFGQKIELEHLDISFNLIKMVGGEFIALMSNLKSLNFAYNSIVEIKQSDWQVVPANLTSINLTGNPIRCDCSIKWLNGTFPVHVAIPGSCSTPDEYRNSRLRQASRHMNERCDAAGNIGTKKKKTSK